MSIYSLFIDINWINKVLVYLIYMYIYMLFININFIIIIIKLI